MLVKSFSLLFLAAGIFILVQVIMPAVSFKLWEVTSKNKEALINPKAESENYNGI